MMNPGSRVPWASSTTILARAILWLAAILEAQEAWLSSEDCALVPFFSVSNTFSLKVLSYCPFTSQKVSVKFLDAIIPNENCLNRYSA
mmetsp:Transcript_47674/g.99749  ORF Transcript_47674/g.99749 Transcript_47674/m.99749 type:complete len:88 (+) Transcript_47674:377-640(+)